MKKELILNEEPVSREEFIKRGKEKGLNIVGITYKGSRGNFKDISTIDSVDSKSKNKIKTINSNGTEETTYKVCDLFDKRRNKSQVEQMLKDVKEKPFFSPEKWISADVLSDRLGKANTGVKVNEDAYEENNNENFEDKEYAFDNNIHGKKLLFNKEKNPIIYLICKKKKDHNVFYGDKKTPKNINILNGSNKEDVINSLRLNELLKRLEERENSTEEERWCTTCAGTDPKNYQTPFYESQLIQDVRRPLNKLLRKNYGFGARPAKHGLYQFKDKNNDNVSYDGYIKLEKKVPINLPGRPEIEEIRFDFDGSSHVFGNRVLENDFFRYTIDKDNPNILYIVRKGIISPKKKEKSKSNERTFDTQEIEYDTLFKSLNFQLRNLFKPLKLRHKNNLTADNYQKAEGKFENYIKNQYEKNLNKLSSIRKNDLKSMINSMELEPQYYNYKRRMPDGTKIPANLTDFLKTDEGKKSVLDNGKQWGVLFGIGIKNPAAIEQWKANHQATVGEIDFKRGIYPTPGKEKPRPELKKLFEEIKKRTSK